MRQRFQFLTSFCFLKKLYSRLKQVVTILVLIHFATLRFGYNRSMLCNISDYQSRDIIKFRDFKRKVLGLASPPQSVQNFSRKILHMLSSFKRPSFIVWLLLLLVILGNMFIVFCQVCDVTNFEIYHSFFIQLLLHTIKRLGQKCKYLKNEKSFLREIKSIFHHFERISLTQVKPFF